MAKVEIGKEGNLQECDIKSYTDDENKKYWYAITDVTLPTDKGENELGDTFVIKVTPIDAEKYPVVECKYILKGTKASMQNAEFAIDTKGKPRVFHKITWKAGFKSNYYDDYGAEKVVLQAMTVSPRAKVKYQFVNPVDDQPISGAEIYEFTHQGKGVHKSEEIVLYTDKPTRIKAWVVAEDEHTTDELKGVWMFTYNPIPMLWSLDSKASLDKFTQSYDEIKITKEQLKTVKDGKIAILFRVWKPDFGFTVDNTGLPNATHTEFVNRGEYKGLYIQYVTLVDVSQMIADPQTHTEAEVVLKTKGQGIDCFEYKVKVKLDSYFFSLAIHLIL